MRRFENFRVRYFEAVLHQLKTKTPGKAVDREIHRRPGNPMLRYAKIAAGEQRENKILPQEDEE